MDYKVIDDSNLTYLVVEYKGEVVTLHPSTQEHRIIKDGICVVEDDHWTLKKDTHAIRCGCGKCRGLFNSFMDKVAKSGAIVVDSSQFKK